MHLAVTGYLSKEEETSSKISRSRRSDEGRCFFLRCYRNPETMDVHYAHTGEEATGSQYIHPITRFPSIIVIGGQSIILTTLTMLSDSDYRKLVVSIAKSPEREHTRTVSWHESMSTLLLGTLSVSLGLSAVGALAIRDPSFDLMLVAFVGQWLGMGGIFLSRRRGRGMTPLPVLGTGLCLVLLAPIYLLLLLSLVVILLPIALLYWGVHILMRATENDRSLPTVLSKTIRWFGKRNSLQTSQSTEMQSRTNSLSPSL